MQVQASKDIYVSSPLLSENINHRTYQLLEEFVRAYINSGGVLGNLVLEVSANYSKDFVIEYRLIDKGSEPPCVYSLVEVDDPEDVG